MLIGYARVSSGDQNLNLQKDALTRAGCERILEDRQSGAKADRAGLRDALDYARDGDTLTVWRLDRLSRSLKDLIDLVSQLEGGYWPKESPRVHRHDIEFGQTNLSRVRRTGRVRTQSYPRTYAGWTLPRHEARGDMESALGRSTGSSCFNPLPLPKQGEMLPRGAAPTLLSS